MKIVAKLTVLCTALGMAVATSQGATGAPVLDPLYNGVSVVSGVAAPGAGPIDVFDTSTAVKTKIGTASMTAADGKFYCAVKPSLMAGHHLIAVDKTGKVSAVGTVAQSGPRTTTVP